MNPGNCVSSRAEMPSRAAAISILLPVRNAAETLPNAIESTLSQTFQDWEMILVDDGSADESRKITQRYRQRDKRIHLIQNPEAGIVKALQAGCAASSAPLIARMDADDVMHPERLHKQVEFLERHPEIGLVACLVNYGGNRTAQAGYAEHVDWINSLVTPEEIYLRRFVESPAAHPSVMFRTQLLKEHGGYQSGDFPEDYELWLRWMNAGVRFGKVEAQLLTWNDPPSRLSRVNPRYSVEAFYGTKCRYLALWLQRKIVGRRSVWLWGAGRITRKRFAALEQHGVRIEGFIDIDLGKIGKQRDGRPVLPPEKMPPAREAFILAGVGTRGARTLIQAELNANNRVEGQDYLLAA